jgi:probable HAF family extracellular repeat protein
VRWIDGKHDLFLGASTIGEATAVNSNGTQIVGQAPGSNGYGAAFLYSDKKGLLSIGTLRHSPTEQSVANGISDNGLVIGWSGDPFGHGIEAFVWTSAGGLERLERTLRHLGATIPNGTILTTAVSISADGSTMAGQYVDSQFNFGNWIAHITK